MSFSDLSAGAREPAVRLVRPGGLRRHAGLAGREEIPRRGHHPQLQGQVPAQGRQEGAALVSHSLHSHTRVIVAAAHHVFTLSKMIQNDPKLERLVFPKSCKD